MNLQEAIEVLKIEKGVAELDLSNDDGNIHTEEFVLACDLVLEALEKQIPKKPIEKHYEEIGEKPYIKYKCPNCDSKYQLTSNIHNYCFNCGQKLDWED